MKHFLFPFICFQHEYFEDLSKTADIEKLKPVYAKIHGDSDSWFAADLFNYRKNVYRIVDDETFVITKG